MSDTLSAVLEQHKVNQPNEDTEAVLLPEEPKLREGEVRYKAASPHDIVNIAAPTGEAVCLPYTTDKADMISFMDSMVGHLGGRVIREAYKED